MSNNQILKESEFRNIVRRKLIERVLLEQAATMANRPTKEDEILDFRSWVNQDPEKMASLTSLYNAADMGTKEKLDLIGTGTSTHFNMAWQQYGELWLGKDGAPTPSTPASNATTDTAPDAATPANATTAPETTPDPDAPDSEEDIYPSVTAIKNAQISANKPGGKPVKLTVGDVDYYVIPGGEEKLFILRGSEYVDIVAEKNAQALAAAGVIPQGADAPVVATTTTTTAAAPTAAAAPSEESGVGREPRKELVLDKYVLKYSDGNKDALILYLPKAYRPRDGTKSSNGWFLNLGDPRSVEKIRSVQQVPKSQRNFILNFGRYDGMVSGESLFTSNEVDLETLESLTVFGPDLPLSSIKDTDLGETVDAIIKVGKYLERLEKKLQGQNDTFKAKMKKVKDLASALKDAKFDEVLVKRSGGDNIRRARFTGNVTPAGVDLPLLDKINGRIVDGKFSVKKAKEAYKDKELSSFLSIDDAVNESVEKEIYNIIKDIIHQDQKKKLAERIFSQDNVSNRPGMGRNLDSGDFRLSTSRDSSGTLLGAMVTGGVGATIFDKISGREYNVTSDIVDGLSKPLKTNTIKVTSHAGQRKRGLHSGIDFRARVGEEVLAIASGNATVTTAEEGGDCCGLRVKITGISGVNIGGVPLTSVVYCHLSKVNIGSGQVNAGDVIGLSGGAPDNRNTGYFERGKDKTDCSTAPHLHVSLNGSSNKEFYLEYIAKISTEAREDIQGEVEEANGDGCPEGEEFYPPTNSCKKVEDE